MTIVTVLYYNAKNSYDSKGVLLNILVTGGAGFIGSHLCEEGEQDSHQSDEGEPGRFASPPTRRQPSVQDRGVDEPRDEGPCLLGIPTPVGTPGVLGPYRTGDDAKS